MHKAGMETLLKVADHILGSKSTFRALSLYRASEQPPHYELGTFAESVLGELHKNDMQRVASG